jgi:crossover junction endodeoxyribonuclease RusA
MNRGADVELEFPIEFIVQGTPVSFQATRVESKSEWKKRVKDASSQALPDGHWASEDRIAVTMLYFPDGPMQGDIDNIIKLVLDALSRHIYMDDSQVERIVVQKFEPDKVFEFGAPSLRLVEAINYQKPVLYIRVTNNPSEELS